MINCPRCGYQMIDIQTCHHFCHGCGAVVDCSDGYVFELRLMSKSEHTRLFGHRRTIDMSGRHCTMCSSTETYIMNNGRPHWDYIDGQLVCKKCYNRHYLKTNYKSKVITHDDLIEIR